MDEEAEKALQQIVDPDERLLWAGRPRRGLLLRRHDIILIPLSLAFVGLFLFTEIQDFLRDPGFYRDPILTRLSELPVYLVVLYVAGMGLLWLIVLYPLFGRFIYDAVNRRRTIYGVTTERAIIRSGFFRPTVRSYPIESLADIDFVEHRNGRGSLRLQRHRPKPLLFDMYGTKQFLTGTGRWGPMFDHIANARNVYALLSRTRDHLAETADDHGNAEARRERDAGAVQHDEPRSASESQSTQDDSSEELLWSGQPRFRPEFHYYDVFLLFFGFGWFLVALVMMILPFSWSESSVWEQLQNPVMWLILIALSVFVAIGFYLSVGRFLYDFWNCRNMLYSITDRRLLIRSGVFRRSVKTFHLNNIWDVDLLEHGNGFGTIRFQTHGSKEPTPVWSNFGVVRPATVRDTTAFRQIADARRVYATLRDAQRNVQVD